MDHWFVVADFGRARIFEQPSAKAPPRETLGIDNSERRKRADELVSDRAGTKERGASHRTTVPQHSDPKDVIGERFARELADFLDGTLREGRFGSLSIVAAPRLLGRLRPLLSSSVSKSVEDTYPLDLINVEANALSERLRELRASG